MWGGAKIIEMSTVETDFDKYENRHLRYFSKIVSVNNGVI